MKQVADQRSDSVQQADAQWDLRAYMTGKGYLVVSGRYLVNMLYVRMYFTRDCVEQAIMHNGI